MQENHHGAEQNRRKNRKKNNQFTHGHKQPYYRYAKGKKALWEIELVHKDKGFISSGRLNNTIASTNTQTHTQW